MKRVIAIDLYILNIDTNPSESDEIFYDRVNFIKNNLNKYSLNYLVNMSKYYANIKYKKCIYSNEIMDKIKNFNAHY
jgi:hypothetical protein